MAFGTLKADTLTHSTAGSLATNFVVEGSAKARLTASDAAVLTESFNISSGTDNGTGDYSYSLTSSFSTSTFQQNACTRITAFNRSWNSNTGRLATGTLATEMGDSHTNALSDLAHIIIAHGDLA